MSKENICAFLFSVTRIFQKCAEWTIQNNMFTGPCIIVIVEEWRPTWCHLLFYEYFTSYVLNIFRTLIYPSSEACDCVVELPHRSSCSHFVVCWSFGAAGVEWCSFCRLKHNFSLQNEHHSKPATPNLQHTTNWEQDDRCGNSTV
jgi:hypothetical protein